MRSTYVAVACIAFTAIALTRNGAAEHAPRRATSKDEAAELNSAPATHGETLADAAIRINAEVEQKYGVLAPTPLTVTRIKAAIEAAAEELANSEATGRLAYVNTLTAINANDRIPSSINFYVAPIIGTYSKPQKEKLRDGRHVDISLNYVLEVPSGNGRRAIGLTDIVELFRITKPKEQKVPLPPPPIKSQR